MRLRSTAARARSDCEPVFAISASLVASRRPDQEDPPVPRSWRVGRGAALSSVASLRRRDAVSIAVLRSVTREPGDRVHACEVCRERAPIDGCGGRLAS
jgi:hypothetical protein